jgi:hypothetical protein
MPMSELTLSALVPIVHSSVYIERCLRSLNAVLAQEPSLTPAEAILSPTHEISIAMRAIPAMPSLQVVIIPPLSSSSQRSWSLNRKPCDCVPSDTECRCRFEHLFSSTTGAKTGLRHDDDEESVSEPVPLALNRAARAARGRFLLLLDDLTNFGPLVTALAPLRRALDVPGVGVAGGRLLDGHGRIHNAGMGVALGQLPAVRDRFGRRSYLAPSRASEPLESAVPVPRWRGLPSEGGGPRGPWLGGGAHDGAGELVRGVGLEFLFTSRALWRALGGLNSTMPPDFAALDLCLRAAADERLQTVYTNASSALLDLGDLGDLGERAAAARGTYQRHAASSSSAADERRREHFVDAWRDRWGPQLATEIRAGWRLALPMVGIGLELDLDAPLMASGSPLMASDSLLASESL